MGWKQVTLDIAIDYGLYEVADLMRWEMLIMEIENRKHSIESLKETDAFYGVSMDFNVSDEYLKKLIQIHENLHPKTDL